jgi:hypothetical protein
MRVMLPQGQTQRWNRDIVGNRRYGELGIAHLPIKALDTLQPVYGSPLSRS